MDFEKKIFIPVSDMLHLIYTLFLESADETSLIDTRVHELHFDNNILEIGCRKGHDLLS